MQKRQFTICLFLIFFIITIIQCGGDAPYDVSEDLSEDTETSDIYQTNLNLNFTLSLELDADEDAWDFDATVPGSHILPLNLDESGNLTLRAQDMQKIVYRVCDPDTTTSGCHAYSEETSGMDLDLVIDSCGRFVDDADCGPDDDTEFSGTIDDDGSMTLSNLSIRIRTFLISNNSDGYTANDTDSGIITMSRLIVSFTTENTGTPIQNKSVTLVGTGTVSSVSGSFPGANFVATITGTFDVEPINLISR